MIVSIKVFWQPWLYGPLSFASQLLYIAHTHTHTHTHMSLCLLFSLIFISSHLSRDRQMFCADMSVCARELRLSSLIYHTHTHTHTHTLVSPSLMLSNLYLI